MEGLGVRLAEKTQKGTSSEKQPRHALIGLEWLPLPWARKGAAVVITSIHGSNDVS